ncbi:MAG: hypothetical protein HYS41_02095 [Candidatus Omnitrophica bacterium]|nr:hypothetical protein [Candidatus Omnitrophota bacterium]
MSRIRDLWRLYRLAAVPGSEGTGNEPEVSDMAEGGFLVTFDAKKAKPQRCYAVAFDYDEWAYSVNDKKKAAIPKGTAKITIEIEL